MTKPLDLGEHRRVFSEHKEHSLDALVNAMAEAYKMVKGRELSQRGWEKVREAVEFET